MRWIHSLLVAAVLTGACRAPAAVDGEWDVAAWREEVEVWHRERQERLREPDGWLTLVGLYWLREGENRFGSHPSNDLVFPEATPELMGTLYRRGTEVRLEAVPDAGIHHDGAEVRSLYLRSDADGPPTVLRAGSLSFYLIVRGEDVGLRVKDSASPGLQAFSGIKRYPVDPAWRLVARFEGYDAPRSLDVPNVLGKSFQEPSPGAVIFEVDGETQRIEALNGDGGELFLVFGDRTNGGETYGGGRFLYTDPPTADARVVVDFNRAYNPPCVFTPYATCPLPPPQNRLPFEVRAGEKMYGDAH